MCYWITIRVTHYENIFVSHFEASKVVYSWCFGDSMSLVYLIISDGLYYSFSQLLTLVCRYYISVTQHSKHKTPQTSCKVIHGNQNHVLPAQNETLHTNEKHTHQMSLTWWQTRTPMWRIQNATIRTYFGVKTKIVLLYCIFFVCTQTRKEHECRNACFIFRHDSIHVKQHTVSTHAVKMKTYSKYILHMQSKKNSHICTTYLYVTSIVWISALAEKDCNVRCSGSYGGGQCYIVQGSGGPHCGTSMSLCLKSVILLHCLLTHIRTVYPSLFGNSFQMGFCRCASSGEGVSVMRVMVISSLWCYGRWQGFQSSVVGFLAVLWLYFQLPFA